MGKRWMFYLQLVFVMWIVSIGMILGNVEAQSSDPFVDIKVQIDQSGKIVNPRSLVVSIENMIYTGMDPVELRFIVVPKDSSMSTLESVKTQLHDYLKQILTDYEFDVTINKSTGILQISETNPSYNKQAVEEKLSYIQKQPTVPEIIQKTSLSSLDIPVWVKNTAEWWVGGQVSDMEFISAMKYLIESKIIQLSDESVDTKYFEEYKLKTEQEMLQYQSNSQSLNSRIGNLEKENQKLQATNNMLEKTNLDLRKLNSELTNQNYDIENVLKETIDNLDSPYDGSGEWNKQYIEEVAKTNPLIKGVINGKLRFYIEPLPYYAAPGIEEQVKKVSDSLEGRSIANLKFERVYDANYSDLYISWVKNYGSHTLGEAIFKSHVKVGLGGDNCYGDWQAFDSSSVTKIMWHEIGHSLGFGHSADRDNVMYESTDTRFEEDYLDSFSLTRGYYNYLPFCNSGSVYYEITSDDQYNGFDIYVLPPTSDPKGVLEGTDNIYSDCGEYRMVSYSDTCNVADGSGLMIHNRNDNDGTAINIDVRIVNMSESIWPDMVWDMDAFEYDLDQINEVWALYN